MHVSQFAICHLAPNIFPNAPMFQAQQASIRGFNQSTRPRAMSPGNHSLQSTRQYVMDKVMVEFPNFYGFSKHKLRHAFCYLKYTLLINWDFQKHFKQLGDVSGHHAANQVTSRHTRSLGRAQCHQVTKHRVMCIVI